MSQKPVDQQRYTGTLRSYKTVEPSQKDSTPFKYRKRCAATKNGATKPETAGISNVTGRKPAPLQQGKTVLVQCEPKAVADYPPMLEISFGHDSSFAPGLNMALVDEHLNSRLPKDPTSIGKSSALKKALRRELRDSGAEIIRAPGEPESSQPESTR